MFVAREINSDLLLFNNMPIRREQDDVKEWVDITSPNGCIGKLPNDLFDNLRWEDEPVGVGIYLYNDRLQTVKVEVSDMIYEKVRAVEDYNELPWYKKILKFKI